ncbi:hypothetical protein H5410_052354 [Solanum commersonii]|uniref:Uncharacterized protein n=1 Tax=Solanum commersonii TaxID=4109 RepID=A0A9J5X201_SOLCO|nr:hypothetical protein H5410_052354 [Solanum commersonii]
MRRMWRHLAESPRLRYLPWAKILQTRWGRHRAKLEAQMATLLHHIQPWMQKSIAESEARVE